MASTVQASVGLGAWALAEAWARASAEVRVRASAEVRASVGASAEVRGGSAGLVEEKGRPRPIRKHESPLGLFRNLVENQEIQNTGLRIHAQRSNTEKPCFPAYLNQT